MRGGAAGMAEGTAKIPAGAVTVGEGADVRPPALADVSRGLGSNPVSCSRLSHLPCLFFARSRERDRVRDLDRRLLAAAFSSFRPFDRDLEARRPRSRLRERRDRDRSFLPRRPLDESLLSFSFSPMAAGRKSGARRLGEQKGT